MAQQLETEPRREDTIADGRQRRASEPPPEAPRSFIRRHPAGIIVGLVLIAILAVGGIWLWSYLSSYESTDDAQIDGHIYPISSRVSGRVTAVNADFNQQVTQGQILIQLDPSDYKIALDRARADLARSQADARAAQTEVPVTRTATASQTSGARAGVEQAQAAVSSAEQQHAAAQARIREAQANYAKAQKDVERFRPLAQKQEISQQQFDQAVAAANALAATVDTAEASAAAAARQVAEARARVAQAKSQEAATLSAPQQVAGTRARAASQQASVQASSADVERAALNLQYTRIASPVSGIVGRRSVEVGQQIQAGQELMAVVPLTGLWVTANFKETQLKNMHVGQRATIHVDAIDRNYNAHVDSFPGATGAKFSILPPENATGNFVKVVQRLPVKLVFDAGQDTQELLRPGMSVEAKVWIR